MANKKEREFGVLEGRWDISYQYATGATASRFFEALKSDGILLATKCSSCGRTMLPPRQYCERCFVLCDEWVEVGPQGTLVAFTINYRPFLGVDKSPPYMLGLIRVDGADTNLLHLVEGIDLGDPPSLVESVRNGIRVQALLRPPHERQGTILDISSFWPLEPGEA